MIWKVVTLESHADKDIVWQQPSLLNYIITKSFEVFVCAAKKIFLWILIFGSKLENKAIYKLEKKREMIENYVGKMNTLQRPVTYYNPLVISVKPRQLYGHWGAI